MRDRSAAVAFVSSVGGLATPLVGAVPLVVLARRDGDLLPGLIVFVVGIVLGAAGILFGVIGRRSAEPGTPDRRWANLGIWFGTAAILASVIVFVVLVEAAVSTFEF
jgi:hypothetical protein